MEDVLDLYAEPCDAERPVVCFDETSTQLLADVREPPPPQPGRPRRQDYGYRRGGTRNIFLTCEPKAALRQAQEAPRVHHRAAHHAGLRPPDAVAGGHRLSRRPGIRVVLDNLNIHRMASLYETSPAAEARRIVKRLEFHHTPKHASWLNMAEIEFSVLTRDCLRGRHGDDLALAGAIDAYEARRNAARATIHWRFSTQDARTKLHRLYPCNS